MQQENIDLLLLDLEDLLKVRNKSMYQQCDPSQKTQFSIDGTKTLRRIKIIRDQKCRLKQLFLINLLIATTRTWMQFELSKKKILGYTHSHDVKRIETLLEFIFTNPPTLKVVGYSSATALAEIRFLLRTDIFENILKQKVSVKQVENYFQKKFFCEFSFKEYKEAAMMDNTPLSMKDILINIKINQKIEMNIKLEQQVSDLPMSIHTTLLGFSFKIEIWDYFSPLKFEIRIFKSIEDYENGMDFVESGDYFDYFANEKKNLTYNPYSLLIDKQDELIN